MSENKSKKDVKVRTSITISPEVLEQVRRVCERGAVSVSSFMEEAVVAHMQQHPAEAAPVVSE